MAKPAATIDSFHTCPQSEGSKPHVGGKGISGKGSPNVKFGGKSALRQGDPLECKGPIDFVQTGSQKVEINGKKAARVGDSSMHGGEIKNGVLTILIG